MSYGSGWIDQWNRVSRWRERVLRDRDEWQNTGLGTEHFLDELHATFQAIWHLKDWLHNDIHAAVTKKDIEDWVKTRGSVLLVAADLANGSKHFDLLNQRAGGSHQSRADVRVYVGQGVQATFYVQDEQSHTEWEAVDLADACIAEWRQFLTETGLPIPDRRTSED